MKGGRSEVHNAVTYDILLVTIDKKIKTRGHTE